MTVGAMPAAGPATTLPQTGRRWPCAGEWTYDDFLALPDDGNRYEVIEGVLYVSPPPSVPHQRRLTNLCRRVGNFVKHEQLGELFVSPIALLMPNARPVQPDAFFVARDSARVVETEQYLEGVPDLVVEAASPSSAGYDRREKQDAYARAGVPEYWILHPVDMTIELLRLEDGKYRSLGIFGGESLLPTQALAGLPYSVAELLG